MSESGNQVVLAIDTDTSSLETLSRAVEPLGHRVVCVRSRKDALRVFQDLLPRVVFLNLTLEGRSSSRLCTEMKRTEHGLLTPVVLLSDDKGRNRLDVMKTHRAADYLPKPLVESKVRTVVAWALGPPDPEASVFADELLDRYPALEKSEGAVSLESGSLPYLLGRSEEERMTGTLLVQRRQFRKALVFREGRIVGARSNVPADQIARVLLAMRLLTPGELSRTLTRMSRDTDLFDALQVMGFVRSEIRQQVLRYRALSIGLSLFRWMDGSLQFLPGEALETDVLEEPLRPFRLAVLGLRSTPALLEVAEKRFLRDDVVFFKKNPVHLLAKNGEEFLTLHERSLAALADGARCVRDIRDVGRLARWDVSRALAVLAGTGLLQRYGAATPRRPAEEPVALLPAAPSCEVFQRGELEARPFVELLGGLVRSRATGTLAVRGMYESSFVLLEGEVVCARSTSSETSLGQVLLRERLIGAADLQEALARQRWEPERRLGTLLVETGVLTLGALSEALRRQILQVLDQVFASSAGSVEFTPSAGAPEWSVRLGISTHELLRRGSSGLADQPLRRRWLPHGAENRLLFHDEAVDLALFSPLEHRMRRVAGDGSSIRELLAVGPSELQVLRTLEFWAAMGFAELAAIEPVSLPEGAPAEAELVVEQLAEEAAQPTAEDRAPELLSVTASLGQTQTDDRAVVSVVETSAEATPATVGSSHELGALVAVLREALASERDERRACEKEIRGLMGEVARLTERLRMAETPSRQAPGRAKRGGDARAATPEDAHVAPRSKRVRVAVAEPLEVGAIEVPVVVMAEPASTPATAEGIADGAASGPVAPSRRARKGPRRTHPAPSDRATQEGAATEAPRAASELSAAETAEQAHKAAALHLALRVEAETGPKSEGDQAETGVAEQESVGVGG